MEWTAIDHFKTQDKKERERLLLGIIKKLIAEVAVSQCNISQNG